MRKLKVLVLFDSAGTPPADQDYAEQFEHEDWFTEAAVAENLKCLGHEVRLMGIYDDIRPLVDEIEQNRPDVVFNLTEIFLGKAFLDKNIPSLLELLQVPYTGCGPASLMICNNKILTKKILSYHRIKVPNFHIFRRGGRIWRPKKLRFPLMVKPSQEEASTGIAQASFVEREKDLRDRVEFIHERFEMPAIVEEYIDGRELYVSILGNKRLRVFPFRETKFVQVPSDGPKLATYKAKWDKDYRARWGIKNEFAGRLPNGIPEKITRTAKRAYRALMLDSHARLDLRLTPQGDIYILEGNANPEIAQGDEFAESAEKGGVPYDKLVEKMLRIAFQRESTLVL
ncbi:MAG: ATP-grasp domain-containing protein [Candidatus Omnitrophica bacterium]|nr:ATP-grasp domain-containing protein [Candidatus Omnitrophota bacterium]